MKYIHKPDFFRAIGYAPHDSQWLFHNSQSRFRIACCGRRWGKSHAAARDREPELFLPNKRFWIVGPTYDLSEKEFRVMWDDLIIGRRFGDQKNVKRAYNKRAGEMYIEFPWKTRIECRSAQHPEQLVGEGLDGVIMSEAAKHNAETWERFIRPALADRRGWGDFVTTPEGHNWLYDLWQFGRDPQFKSTGQYESWNFPSWDNPHVYPGGRSDPEILLLERTMSEEQFAQEIEASFSSFSGKIYGEFDENVHVQQVKFDPNLPNYIAFDWGYVNPLAAVEFQIDTQDNVRIWREHYESYLMLEDHLRILSTREQPPDYHLDLTFGDAADPEAIMVVNQKFAPCMGHVEAKANWRQGVELVKRFLKSYPVGYDDWDRPIEKPKLTIDHSCKNIIREFNTYKKKDTTAPLKEHASAGAALRQDDHALDAIRYGLMEIFELGATAHLSDIHPTHGVEALEIAQGNSQNSGYFTTRTLDF